MCGGDVWRRKKFWGAGEEFLITFRDLWSTVKIILGSTRKYFKRAGEIWALFSNNKEALPPPPPLGMKARAMSRMQL